MIEYFRGENVDEYAEGFQIIFILEECKTFSATSSFWILISLNKGHHHALEPVVTQDHGLCLISDNIYFKRMQNLFKVFVSDYGDWVCRRISGCHPPFQKLLLKKLNK